MIQLCRKDKEKVYQAIRSGNIDAADMAFPNLIDDIVLTMKKHGCNVVVNREPMLQTFLFVEVIH